MGSRAQHSGLSEGPKRRPGTRLPLFDRLVDADPRLHEEVQPHRVLTGAEIQASIRRELSRLLNTRCVETLDALGGQERTVVNYGLPDFFTLSPTSDGDRERLARLIVDAVRVYEPRLRNPSARVMVDPQQTRALLVVLDGMLMLENLLEPVSFPLVIQHRGAMIEVEPAGGV
jgi:type VI secretion system lysozyme-like protein